MTISCSEVSLIGPEQSFTSCGEKIGTKNELETKVENIFFRLIYSIGKHFLKGGEKSLTHFQ